VTTFHERIQYTLGGHIVTIAELQTQLEEAKAKIVELEAKVKELTEKTNGA